MFNVDPAELITQIKSGANPQQLLMGILESNMKKTPMGENLLKLVKEGNGTEIEKIVRNICDQKGIDFDKEFNAFKNNLGLK